MMVLAVSRWAQRGTSGMIEGLAACFTGLEDPRETRRCDHQLVDILVIAVCAVIACAESWEDIELYRRSKRAWLETFLALPNGIPSHDTFRRVFMLLDPDALHWVLDVTFREDDSRVRDRTAARNLALLRKIARNLVTRDCRGRASRRGRRKMAAWNDDYMLQIITGQAHA